MLCFNTFLRDRITEDDSCAKENSPTEASKTSSIEIVNKAYESLQEPQGFRGPEAIACRKSNLELAIQEMSEIIGTLAVIKKYSSVHSPGQEDR